MTDRFQALVFDIGRVLVEVDVARAVRHLAGSSGADPYEVEFALFGAHHRRFSRGELSAEDFHREVIAHLGREVPFGVFAEAWCDMFGEVPGMGPLVGRLSHRYPIYLCSNTDPLHYQHLRTSQPVLAFARGAVLSYEAGCEKPEAGIYRELLGRFGLVPERTLFVDDRQDNVAGAEAEGLTGLVFEGVEALRADLAQLGVLAT